MWSWLLLLPVKCRCGRSVYLQQPKTWSRLVKTGSQTLSRLNELISYTAYLPISPLFLQLIIRSFSKSVVLCFIAVARSFELCGVTHNSWTAVRSNLENKWRAVGDQSGEWGCVSVCVCFVFQPVFRANRDPTTVHDTVCLSVACLGWWGSDREEHMHLYGRMVSADCCRRTDLRLFRHHASQTSAQVEMFF